MTPRISRAAFPLALALVAAGLLVADDSGKSAVPAPQMKITAPFFDGLVGSWTTESKATHEGQEHGGRGRATFERGVGDTAVLQSYENVGPGHDGAEMQYFGHGVWKVAADGKTVTLWWFSNLAPDVMKLTGPVTADGVTLTGPSPQGTEVKITMRRAEDGFAFEMNEGKNSLKETYRPAKSVQ
jgi:hypothetical protein